MREFSRIPSTLATSRISALWSSLWAVASAAANTIAASPQTANEAVIRRMAFPLESHDSQNPLHDRVGRTRAFADDSFAFDLDFQIAHTVRGYGISGIEIARPHQPAQNHDLALIVHHDLALGLNHQGAARQHRRYPPGERGTQRRSRSRLRFSRQRLRGARREQILNSSGFNVSRQRADPRSC